MKNTNDQSAPKPGGDFLSELMDRSAMPRNQVAAMSGMSNTYLRNLEQGRVANIDRGRIISLGLALSLELADIDTLVQDINANGLKLRVKLGFGDRKRKSRK